MNLISRKQAHSNLTCALMIILSIIPVVLGVKYSNNPAGMVPFSIIQEVYKLNYD